MSRGRGFDGHKVKIKKGVVITSSVRLKRFSQRYGGIELLS